jgi:hypothetical protein
MPDENDLPPADEQSGAGYGNNATEDVGKPGESEEAEAHPS